MVSLDGANDSARNQRKKATHGNEIGQTGKRQTKCWGRWWAWSKLLGAVRIENDSETLTLREKLAQNKNGEQRKCFYFDKTA